MHPQPEPPPARPPSRPFMPLQQLVRKSPHGVGWSVPIVATIVAAPALAASCLANLATQAFFPNETPDSNPAGEPPTRACGS